MNEVTALNDIGAGNSPRAVACNIQYKKLGLLHFHHHVMSQFRSTITCNTTLLDNTKTAIMRYKQPINFSLLKSTDEGRKISCSFAGIVMVLCSMLIMMAPTTQSNVPKILTLLYRQLSLTLSNLQRRLQVNITKLIENRPCRPLIRFNCSVSADKFCSIVGMSKVKYWIPKTPGNDKDETRSNVWHGSCHGWRSQLYPF